MLFQVEDSSLFWLQVPDISEKGLGCSGEHSVCWLPGQLLTVVRGSARHSSHF
jgi:hypothetical protein